MTCVSADPLKATSTDAGWQEGEVGEIFVSQLDAQVLLLGETARIRELIG